MVERGSGETSERRVRRYGSEAPLPGRRLLRAGPVTVVLEGGDLRYVRRGGEEIVRRVYGAVRDEDWGTVAPRFTRYQVEEREGAGGFVVRFTAEHVAGAIHFVWDGSYEGNADGEITCTFAGEARSRFRRNRIGWCVLHPMSLAGLAATAVTPDGEVAGEFPERIAPHQPFLELTGLRHRTRQGGEVVIRFEGDLFETEDQRNWTDASYKTYSTPLRLPYPVLVEPGERVRQTVTISARGGVAAAVVAEASAAIEVGADAVGALPPIGFGASRRGAPMGERERALLAALRPAHLRVVLDLGTEGWVERLAAAIADAQALGAVLEVEAVRGEEGDGFAELARRLAASEVATARLLVFDGASGVTTEEAIEAARLAAAEAGLATLVGGGSRAYYTQLNRATLPLDRLDVVGYTLNPQVHAFDNTSLVETLPAQAVTVASARAIVGERSLAVGPVTLRPRFNPDATGPEALVGAGELPPSVDPRQSSLFGAGWTVGSVAALAGAGVDSLTYFETTGWRGLVERSDHELRVAAFQSAPGWAFPAYHVFADLAEFAGGGVLPCEVADPLAMAALAVRSGDEVLLLVASFRDEVSEVAAALPRLSGGTIRLLGETSYLGAAEEPTLYRRRATRELNLRGGRVSLRLSPFGIATVRGKIA